ncbi:beta-lactamase [Hoeflea sp. BAL378]|uniref:MBL fold metallo-hydrolase n=1 Tax=Hoeflea sp. BAL378 TaxID=1547437 RepID=UPI0005136068|nr:MBL fold metallo-hydrolase [Hoeflea sp. BAL378]KGF70455.1 beta-lactamase [Hoeflea sp. BAL378]
MTEPEFDKAFEPAHGQAVPVAADVLRVTAPNSGPLTFHGTNSYVVGRETLAVIDPGPEDESHWRTLRAAIAGRPVSHIFVTHTHRDHSPLAARLKAETGAVVVAEGPHRAARPLHVGEVNPLAESSDMEFAPDIAAGHGAVIAGDGWAIETLHTPGHTANHAAFALQETGLVFSGDHVMAWATSIIAPPDGAMGDFMASLDMLAARDDRSYLPGHGGPVREPRQFVRALKTHRRMRERAILARVEKGDRLIADMVKAIYRDTDPRLHGAAALSVLAHLEDLVGRGEVVTDGPPAITGEYRAA